MTMPRMFQRHEPAEQRPNSPIVRWLWLILAGVVSSCPGCSSERVFENGAARGLSNRPAWVAGDQTTNRSTARVIPIAHANAVGRRQSTGVIQVAAEPASVFADNIVVPGDQSWVDTGIDVRQGDALTFLASGKIQIGKVEKSRDLIEKEVGPAGTFFYADSVQKLNFPLPAGANGPAPCFCLIGRIGNSLPFYVGGKMSLDAPETGRLLLGINDPNVTDNAGEFRVQVSRPMEVQPIAFRDMPPPDEPPRGEPLPDCSVVVFYVDGLRPDVVEEMVTMGHLPNIRRSFVDGGTYLVNAFTSFPSDTITSNGNMWTGCYSDRHGLKGQVRFSRHKLTSDSFLEPLGPSRSARQLGPQGWDKAVIQAETTALRLIRGDEQSQQFQESRTSGIPGLYEYLRAAGSDWGTSVLPLMTEIPPLLWTRSMSKQLPYLKAQEAWNYNDDANGHYAVNYLLAQRKPVTIIWLPETDSASHKLSRGQFGSARRTIARADKLIGDVVNELDALGRLDSTYLVLVSDHGHIGGETSHLSRYDLANELFFRPREIAKSGEWVGGGLGLSVRQHRSENRHSDSGPLEFAFVDADATGAARISLPRGHFRSGDWSQANRAADLIRYRIADHIEPLDLPKSIANTAAVDDYGRNQFPVDLVLLKLSDSSILITTRDRGQAVIEREWDAAGKWVYRYTSATNVRPATNGDVVFDEVIEPKADPLGLVGCLDRDFLKTFHDEKTWLWVTTETNYPDSVVSLTRHMLWQDNLRIQELNYAPDLVVTAHRGWFFGTQNTSGSAHGYPFPEAMHASFYVSGPNVRRGARVTTPCRLVDLTPTILELASVPYDPDFLDGRAVRTIFADASEVGSWKAEGGIAKGSSPKSKGGAGEGRLSVDVAAKLHGHSAAAIQSASVTGAGVVRTAGIDSMDQLLSHRRSLYWRDIDLGAWDSLSYAPQLAFEHQPLSIHHPYSPWDLNNIVYNVMTIGDWSVFALADDVISPLVPGRTRIYQKVERSSLKRQRSDHGWVAGGASALNVPGLAIGDYSFTSSGNLKRVDGTVDWLQERGTHLDQRIARKAGKSSVLGAPLANRVIDGTQKGFWETYRFAQRVVVEVLDERILNGIENGVDSAINAPRRTPEEVAAPK
jgi:arylsulfatase A-like enzyme